MSDISIFAQTDVGSVRKGNEDSFLVVDITSEHQDSLPEVKEYDFNNKSNIFVVADGMGGPAAGEVASLMAVNTVQEEIKSKTFSNESEFVEVLIGLLQKANTAIFEKSQSNDEMKGMGTTATLAGVVDKKLFLGQVGDSRAYLIRNNTITQITKDQSYVNQLIEAGTITEEEAENHPQKNIILQALGNQASLKVAVTSVDLSKGDYLLICSDGLSGLLKKEEMKLMIKSSSDLKAACQELIDLTNKRGGHDNITVIIAHFLSNDLSKPSAEKTIPFKVISEYNPLRAS